MRISTNNLVITFCSEKIMQEPSLTLTDRSSILVEDLAFFDQIEKTVSFDIPFPNTVAIKIKELNPVSSPISLKSMSLAGLALPDRILDQICVYQTSTSKTVSRIWNQDGIVTIDFFAPDWIQYHLLYGNKIV